MVVLAQVELDQGYSTVTSWPCPEPVYGTDAFQFRPCLTEQDSLRVWVSELYRSASLVVQKTLELYGVTLLRYWPVRMCIQLGSTHTGDNLDLCVYAVHFWHTTMQAVGSIRQCPSYCLNGDQFAVHKAAYGMPVKVVNLLNYYQRHPFIDCCPCHQYILAYS